jgi:hypothetical protein
LFLENLRFTGDISTIFVNSSVITHPRAAMERIHNRLNRGSVIDNKEHTFAKRALLLYFLHIAHNSVIIIIISSSSSNSSISIINNQYYNSYSSLGIVSYWLLRNCAQKLGAWVADFEKITDGQEIETVFWWKIRAPRMSSQGVWGIYA